MQGVTYGRLRGKMTEKGISQVQLAKKLGISSKSMSSKLNNHTSMTVPEALKISEVLDIDLGDVRKFFTQSD